MCHTATRIYIYWHKLGRNRSDDHRTFRIASGRKSRIRVPRTTVGRCYMGDVARTGSRVSMVTIGNSFSRYSRRLEWRINGSRTTTWWRFTLWRVLPIYPTDGSERSGHTATSTVQYSPSVLPCLYRYHNESTVLLVRDAILRRVHGPGLCIR